MPLQGEYARSTSGSAAKQAEAYESSGGATANTMRDVPVVILTTRGRRSGKLRKSPLMRVEHEGSYAVVASDGGAAAHPAWYLNLLAGPHVTIQDGAEPLDMVARTLDGPERKEWWIRATDVWPDYDVYQTRTEREIPIVLLEPITD